MISHPVTVASLNKHDQIDKKQLTSDQPEVCQTAAQSLVLHILLYFGFAAVSQPSCLARVPFGKAQYTALFCVA